MVSQIPTASPIDPDDQPGTQPVQVIGNYAYLADAYSGVRIIDVSANAGSGQAARPD